MMHGSYFAVALFERHNNNERYNHQQQRKMPASSPARASGCPFSSFWESSSSDVAPLTCPWQHSPQLQPPQTLPLPGCVENDPQQQEEVTPCNSEDSDSSSSSSSSYVHQAWQFKRPVLQHDPKLTRRQVRRAGANAYAAYVTPETRSTTHVPITHPHLTASPHTCLPPVHRPCSCASWAVTGACRT